MKVGVAYICYCIFTHTHTHTHTAGVTHVLLLETTNIVRKYASWLDVLWSMASARYVRVAIVIEF